MKIMSCVSPMPEILTLLEILRHVDKSTKAGRIIAKLIIYRLWFLRLVKF